MAWCCQAKSITWTKVDPADPFCHMASSPGHNELKHQRFSLYGAQSLTALCQATIWFSIAEEKSSNSPIACSGHSCHQQIQENVISFYCRNGSVPLILCVQWEVYFQLNFSNNLLPALKQIFEFHFTDAPTGHRVDCTILVTSLETFRNATLIVTVTVKGARRLWHHWIVVRCAGLMWSHEDPEMWWSVPFTYAWLHMSFLLFCLLLVIHHNIHFYFESYTYCKILDIYPFIKYEFC